MPHRRFTICSSPILAVTYLALAVTYLAAGRYVSAAIWLVFAIGWAVLARLDAKTPADAVDEPLRRAP